MNFVEATNRNVGWGLITITEETQRQLCHQNLSQLEWQLTNLDTWSARHSLKAVQQAGEGPLQVPQLVYISSMQLNLFVSAAFRQLDLSETDSEKFLLLTYVWGGAPATLISFKDFRKVFWVVDLLSWVLMQDRVFHIPANIISYSVLYFQLPPFF